MAEKHGRDVGPFLPTITPELLRGPYGSPQRDDGEKEEENESDNSVRRRMEEFRSTPPSERINLHFDRYLTTSRNNWISLPNIPQTLE